MKLFRAAVSAIITNANNEILFVSKNGTNNWQVITGWVEDETIDKAILREIKEELNLDDVELIDIIDTHTFQYNENKIISTFYLVKYNSGEIKPGDDINNYNFKWFNSDEIKKIQIICPIQKEIIEKALFYIKMYKKDKYEEYSFYKYKWLN
jgi:ADP-ribose pyrophosphatase YjhB (NUDIX family)